ncbi:phage tail protein [Candidatus Parcubacteria bacterium]|nr:phage tail protein [Candidatus Parcubacteria bacterium]
MMLWLTDTAPSGWLLCYGQAVSRTTYSKLFGILGTTFGVGDASTTFNLPDMRGRVPVGQDDMGGSSANRVTDTRADSLGSASGSGSEIVNIAHTHAVIPDSTAINRSGGGANSFGYDSTAGGTTGAMSGDNTINLLDPYLTVNYIIKF